MPDPVTLLPPRTDSALSMHSSTSLARAAQSARLVLPERQPGAGRIAIEWLVTFVLTMPCLPLIGALWLIVKLTSPGPGLYRQRRAGWHGRDFEILKLRTMTHNCEQHTGAVWSIPGDSRVTPLGAWLRKTHLDELPQLFNVLRGEMALVGPRPERPEIITKLVEQVPGYLHRLKMRPGVTGLAQIFHEPDRTVDDVRRKLSIDLEYLQCMSLWLDLRIVACTALKMVGLNTPLVRNLLFPALAQKLARGIPTAEMAS